MARWLDGSMEPAREKGYFRTLEDIAHILVNEDGPAGVGVGAMHEQTLTPRHPEARGGRRGHARASADFRDRY